MRPIALLIAVGCVLPLGAQTLTEGLEQTYELQLSASSGQTPLWLNANRYGLSSLSEGNAYVRGRVERRLEHDDAKEWGVGYGLDLVVPYHYTSDLVVQQFYAELRYRRAVLTVGQKEQPMELKNPWLSSGSQTLGINARPVPGVRLSVPEYWVVPGLRQWVALKGHLSYGVMTDGGFQRDFTGGISRYGEGEWLHTKAGYLRLGPEASAWKMELGLEMACQFGGTLYHTQYGMLTPGHGLKEMLHAFTASGSDEVDPTYHNVGGNQLGSWVGRLSYTSSDYTVALYADHFFEDHSSMFQLDYDGYGQGAEWDTRKDFRYLLYPMKDLLVGAELELKHWPWLNHVVLEWMNTRYQSGPIYHDHNTGLSDHIGGDDNYYNHYLYHGWSHWGQVLGNPLYRSPLYNTDGTMTVQNNRFGAWHLGLSGEGCGLNYRLLASWQRGYGTYQSPYVDAPRSNLSMMGEVSSGLGRWSSYLGAWARQMQIRVAAGWDHGELLGNNLGAQITLVWKQN